QELERGDAHVHQVAAVDALEALGNHGTDAEQLRALRRPVARRARAVLLAGDDEQWHAVTLVAHRGVVDTRRLARWQELGEAAFGAGRDLVAQADVGKRPAHHHFVVAAPRA